MGDSHDIRLAVLYGSISYIHSCTVTIFIHAFIKKQKFHPPQGWILRQVQMCTLSIQPVSTGLPMSSLPPPDSHNHWLAPSANHSAPLHTWTEFVGHSNCLAGLPPKAVTAADTVRLFSLGANRGVSRICTLLYQLYTVQYLYCTLLCTIVHI